MGCRANIRDERPWDEGLHGLYFRSLSSIQCSCCASCSSEPCQSSRLGMGCEQRCECDKSLSFQGYSVEEEEA